MFNSHRRLSVYLLFLFIPLVQSKEQNSTYTPIVIGEEINIYSKILAENRRLLVHLPKSYQANTKQKYPVLYTLDGEWHFNHNTTTVDWLSSFPNRIPELIIIGIINTDRERDLTMSYNGGSSDKFLNFISTELIPYVDNSYQTNNFRVLSGHSSAGFFTLNTLLYHPQIFNSYIAISPWFHEDKTHQKLTKNTAKILPTTLSSLNRSLFLSIGNEPDLKPFYDDFVQVLSKAAPASLRWESQVYMSENHVSLPSNAFNEAITAVFSPKH